MVTAETDRLLVTELPVAVEAMVLSSTLMLLDEMDEPVATLAITPASLKVVVGVPGAEKPPKLKTSPPLFGPASSVKLRPENAAKSTVAPASHVTVLPPEDAPDRPAIEFRNAASSPVKGSDRLKVTEPLELLVYDVPPALMIPVSDNSGVEPDPV